VGGPAAFGLVVLTSNAFAACDVGINAGANSFALLFVLPVIWVANALVFGAVFARVSDATWKRRALGAVAALLAVVLLAWLLFAWQGTPSDYPSPICHSNIPPWWPSWIPV
jgi:membrane-anchored protein YejM (alkaline phosphatase superfamily)